MDPTLDRDNVPEDGEDVCAPDQIRGPVDDQFDEPRYPDFLPDSELILIGGILIPRSTLQSEALSQAMKTICGMHVGATRQLCFDLETAVLNYFTLSHPEMEARGGRWFHLLRGLENWKWLFFGRSRSERFTKVSLGVLETATDREIYDLGEEFAILYQFWPVPWMTRIKMYMSTPIARGHFPCPKHFVKLITENPDTLSKMFRV